MQLGRSGEENEISFMLKTPKMTDGPLNQQGFTIFNHIINFQSLPRYSQVMPPGDKEEEE